jgi:hypothetical protein
VLDCRLDAVLEEVSRLVCNLWSLIELTASDEDEEDIPYAYCFQFDLMMEWIELSVHSKWFYLPWLLVDCRVVIRMGRHRFHELTRQQGVVGGYGLAGVIFY